MSENIVWPEEELSKLVTFSYILCLNHRVNGSCLHRYHSHTWQKSCTAHKDNHMQEPSPRQLSEPDEPEWGVVKVDMWSSGLLWVTFQLSLLTLPTSPHCLPVWAMTSILPLPFSLIGMLSDHFLSVSHSAWLYSTASTPAGSSTGISHRTVNGLQLKKHTLGWLSKNGEEPPLPCPPRPQPLAHTEKPLSWLIPPE